MIIIGRFSTASLMEKLNLLILMTRQRVMTRAKTNKLVRTSRENFIENSLNVGLKLFDLWSWVLRLPLIIYYKHLRCLEGSTWWHFWSRPRTELETRKRLPNWVEKFSISVSCLLITITRSYALMWLLDNWIDILWSLFAAQVCLKFLMTRRRPTTSTTDNNRATNVTLRFFRFSGKK